MSNKTNTQSGNSIKIANMPNIGFLFYKDYFRDLDLLHLDSNENLLKKKNEALFKKTTDEYLAPAKLLEVLTEHNFSLETTYPGLLIGTGYSHETGSLGELKLGFYFDHTTGLPLIPGSSVKGVCRSMFPGSGIENKEEKSSYIQAVVIELSDGRIVLTNEEVEELENNIFVGIAGRNSKNEPIHVSMYRRDIFFDAFIEKSTHKPSGKRENRMFLGNDYITPHKNTKGKAELDQFSNPTPLQFLKILPGVHIRFQFKLWDCQIGEHSISAQLKQALFEYILRDIGIGAKTNVGYGQFV